MTCTSAPILTLPASGDFAQTFTNAIEWRRTSQAMTELGYLLGYTEDQMDDLFRVAMTVQV